MRFTFLGTSAGLPTRERNVTGLAIGLDQHRHWYLVDCGEATQHRLLRTSFSATRLRAIFITHVHGDHCYGLPGLIASAQMGGRQEPLTICGPAGIAEFVQAACRYTDLHPVYPLQFIRSDEPAFCYDDGDLRVTSVALSHRVPSFGYRLVERVHERHLNPDKLAAAGVPRGPLWGELQQGRRVALDDGRQVTPEAVCDEQRPPRCLVVGGDNDRPELLRKALTGCDVLIHEATYTEDVLARVGPQYQHSTAAQVARVAEEMAVPWLALTHFSQRYRKHSAVDRKNTGKKGHGNSDGHSINDLADEARASYRGGLIMADDLAAYELRRDKQLVGI